jgi:hypothetical protein
LQAGLRSKKKKGAGGKERVFHIFEKRIQSKIQTQV